MKYQQFAEILKDRDKFYGKMGEFDLDIQISDEVFSCLNGMTHNMRANFDEINPVNDMITTLKDMRTVEPGKSNPDVIDASTIFVLRCSFK